MASIDVSAQSSSSGHGPSTTKSMITGCAVCGIRANLSRCGGCKYVQYCCREHQVTHRPAHKDTCKKITKTGKKFDAEEATLQNHPGDWTTPANPLENARGHFWGILDTRDYMRARFAYVDALLETNTRIAVEAGVEAFEDMIQLNRSDNMGLRDWLPNLYLRLGHDQRCYDFCKWWLERYFDDHYDSGDTSQPFLDIKDADVFEPVDRLLESRPGVQNLLPIMLLKIRLLIDLQSLQRARTEIGSLVPQEILDNIQAHVVSDVVSKNRTILQRTDHNAQIQALLKQIRQLFDALRRANEFFGKIMEMEEYRGVRPASYSFGSLEKMIIAINSNIDSWAETRGAKDVLSGLFVEMIRKWEKHDEQVARGEREPIEGYFIPIADE